jgi:hypothetical protein
MAVNGNRSATDDVGPNPGNTPTSVPRKHPTMATSRFTGSRADKNPESSHPASKKYLPEKI